MIDGSMKSWKPACRSQPRRRSGFSCHVGLKCLHGDRQNVNCSHRRKRKRERGAPHPQCDGVWGPDDAMEIDIWGRQREGTGKAVGDLPSSSAPKVRRRLNHLERTNNSPDVDLPDLFALLRDSEPDGKGCINCKGNTKGSTRSRFLASEFP